MNWNTCHQTSCDIKWILRTRMASKRGPYFGFLCWGQQIFRPFDTFQLKDLNDVFQKVYVLWGSDQRFRSYCFIELKKLLIFAESVLLCDFNQQFFLNRSSKTYKSFHFWKRTYDLSNELQWKKLYHNVEIFADNSMKNQKIGLFSLFSGP